MEHSQNHPSALEGEGGEERPFVSFAPMLRFRPDATVPRVPFFTRVSSLELRWGGFGQRGQARMEKKLLCRRSRMEDRLLITLLMHFACLGFLFYFC